MLLCHSGFCSSILAYNDIYQTNQNYAAEKLLSEPSDCDVAGNCFGSTFCYDSLHVIYLVELHPDPAVLFFAILFKFSFNILITVMGHLCVTLLYIS